MILLFGIHCHAQLLKLKDDNSCSTQMASKYRVHSIFINEYLTGKHDGIKSLIQCAKLCSNASLISCLYFIYHLESQICVFVIQHLINAVISRFVFQKWNYGRVLQPSKRVGKLILGLQDNHVNHKLGEKINVTAILILSLFKNWYVLSFFAKFSNRLKDVGPWSNGYQCGMRIPRPGFNSQRVLDHGC